MAQNGQWERIEPYLWARKHQTKTGEWTRRFYVRFRDWKKKLPLLFRRNRLESRQEQEETYPGGK